MSHPTRSAEIRQPGLGGPVQTHRRIVFQGLGFLGVAAALAGCGGGDGGTGGSGGAGKTEKPDAGEALATTSEVPVGGGLILSGAGLVITQPSAGEFKAFTAVCTHEGAALTSVSADGITCPLHGSVFSIDDGSATQGPASSGLTETPIEVRGDEIVAA